MVLDVRCLEQTLVVVTEIRQAGLLDEAVRHVDPETVYTSVEPESQDVGELVAYLRVRPVQVGLRVVEQVQEPLAGRPIAFGQPAPSRAPEHAAPVVRR